ncbi:MAG: hypothetical protein OQJ77_06920 [Thiovulaceae bacterium]|nr:hypothetical protein [Sulfurimonadaceae bacterium]MCW9027033.1 hypothetical protein [Sulfurimonadaceae bacterium]
MEASLLIETIAGLVIVLGILLFIFLKPKNVKKTNTINIKSSNNSDKKLDLDSLRHIIRNRVSTEKQLSEAVDLVIKNYGKIPGKLGLRLNPKFDAYMEILITLCRHPNTNKNIILKFDKELTRLNPEYKSEINDAITKGLNSRK